MPIGAVIVGYSAIETKPEPAVNGTVKLQRSAEPPKGCTAVDSYLRLDHQPDANAIATWQKNYVTSLVYECQQAGLRLPNGLHGGCDDVSIEARPMTVSDDLEVSAFLEAVYLNSIDFKPKAREIIKRGLHGLPRTTEGVLYRKQGALVGALLFRHCEDHPALGRAALHVSFWGYDRRCLGKNETRCIKSSWLKVLQNTIMPHESVALQVAPENARGIC